MVKLISNTKPYAVSSLLVNYDSAVIFTDPNLQQIVLRKFRNKLIKQGNKARAYVNFMQLFDNLKTKVPDIRPVDVLFLALDAVRPSVVIFNKKIGGTTYKLPLLLSLDQSYSKAAHWIIKEASRITDSNKFIFRLTRLVLQAYRGKAYSLLRKRDELHMLALSNRPFLFRLKKIKQF